MKKRFYSTRQVLFATFFPFSLCAILLLFILMTYTIHRQNTATIEEYRNRLLLYNSTMERVLNNSESLLERTTALENPFQAFHYCDTQLQKHLYV